MLRFEDLAVMARTVFGEARGEPYEGRLGVAHCILNRVRADLGNDGKPDWWGEGITAVCLKPWQFSCWLPSDPNRARMLATEPDDPVMLACLKACVDALAGAPDPTNGATHYFATTMPSAPRWADGRVPDLVIGRHAFFRNVQ